MSEVLKADVIVIGSGLAGLVAAAEVADGGQSVFILDQEGEQNLGGQAHWSFGGLFLVDSPEQRRLGIKDSRELAGKDWAATAGYDRVEDYWPRQWAEAYLDFACGEKRAWLHQQGLRFFPIVGWAERGAGKAFTPGNSVPRFHVTWGTGPAVVAPFKRRVLAHVVSGKIRFGFRHRVTNLDIQNGIVVGVAGEVLSATSVGRGEPSPRTVMSTFKAVSSAVIVTSGGIGGNHDLVRQNWPVARLGPPPKFMMSGVPEHVDGYFQGVVERAGARLINGDRMWHYTEGLRNWNPIWPNHGIRVLPGPSSLWLDPKGGRLPFPYYPGGDTLGTLQYITKNEFPYTWFILNRAIIKKEFALSGSEQNPDLTGKSVRLTLGRLGHNVQLPVQKFMDNGRDFIVRDRLDELVSSMNASVGNDLLDLQIVERAILDRDLQATNRADEDPQVAIIRRARKYLSERLIRVVKPAPILSAKDGPLIAVKMNILTRKSLGGLETDLSSRVLSTNGQPIPGLYAADEVAGFGGGGMHGYRSLEGTFLGGCIFSGRIAGRAAVKAVK